MDLKIVEATWGAFIVHEENCPIVERDWNNHGKTEYALEASSVNQVAREMQETLEIPQSLAIVTKRIICHQCVGNEHTFPGSGIKER